MNEFESNLKTALENAGISILPESLQQLAVFYEMVIEKNKVLNLTAITEPEEFIQKHFVDSLSLLTQTEAGRDLAKGKSTRLIDVGTGCGLPGMALKIVCPQLEVVLLDSLKKRLIFLDEVIESLQLDNIVTLHGRAEDLAHDRKYREQFDLVTARAVANLSTLSEYCLPFVKTGGCFAAYKGPDAQEEIRKAEKALCKLGGQIWETNHFLLGTNEGRSIHMIRKTGSTPALYPRKAGIPSKDPL